MSVLTADPRLRRLELTITRRLDGLLRGQYAGLLPGAGTEPAGSREYRPGEDEVRRIDWAVTARTGTPHVRDTIAERELTVHVLVDGTASMDFGTVRLEKRELAVAAVAAVGFLTAGAGNRLGAELLGASGPRRFPARAGRAHLLGILHALLGAPRAAEGASAPELAAALHGLRRGLRRRGLVVVVSDFLDDGPWDTELRRLAQRQQVIAVEVTDPRELELPDVGLLTVVDPETGRRQEVPTGSRRLRERFAEAAAEQRHRVRTAVRAAGAAHVALRTDRDWVADLARHVLEQRRMSTGGVRR
ncbi:DUF58 domain-containing protein [Prauserella muralis]|uniref:DUF58 domain-containing protein n=1 Tax=Prauserella muralis TaxID=588067 RepID=A0A2V4AH17_9PSEU|nr:DUF58 domain-containing protein [Prauserella muralis]PXY19001.1 hypothetical protein BAY60_29730 [Prauserella muralis]TWE28893.1 uncharacterized protein DUF58 [Prauserella muralis]